MILVPGIERVSKVAVIGAGIAGACVAYSLRNRGISVTVFDADDGTAASANPTALIAPRLPRERVPMGRVMAAAYLHAVPFYEALAADSADIWAGQRGTLTLARNDDEAERQQRALKAFDWPDKVMRAVTAAEASDILGVSVAHPGLWFPTAGTLKPPRVTQHLLRGIDITRARVAALEALTTDYDAVVLAAGTGVLDLLAPDTLPMRANRGQLTYIRDMVDAPNVAVTYGGYMTPAVTLPDDVVGHVLGATYARHGEVPAADWNRLRDDDHATMLETLNAYLPGMDDAMVIGGRTALRATVRDYLPIMGNLSDGVWTLTGLGSRGFLTAPLMADVLADQMTGAACPLEADLMAAIAPGRFRST
jgi:tRNA 5-methylaminomethyl-2-thiouridine biosynthesis bifunctional protein